MGEPQFDPNKYLEKHGSSDAGESFNPDQYIQKFTNSAEPDNRGYLQKAVDFVTQPPTVEGTKKATVDAIPITSAGVGEGIGAVAGPVGAISGAGVGNVLGSFVRNGINEYEKNGLSVPEMPTLEGTAQAFKDAGNQFVSGVNQIGVGKMVGAAIGKVADAVKTGAKSSAEAIQSAAQRLGFNATPGMLSDSHAVQGLESSLTQDPTVMGGVTRSDVAPVIEGIKSAANDVLSEAGANSRYQTGVEVSKGISSNLHGRYAEIESAYEPFNQEMPKMIPEMDAKEKLAVQVERAAKGNLSLNGNLEGYATKVSDKLMGAKSLEDIEDVRKQVSASLTSAYQTRDHNLIDGLSKIQDKIANFRDDQFMQMAGEAAGPTRGQMGQSMGNDMVQGYKQAQGLYSSMASDLKELGPILGIRNKNPKSFIEAVTHVEPVEFADKLFKSNKIEALSKVQEYFPEEFEQLRQLQISKIRGNSLDVNDQVDPMKLIRQYDKLNRSNPEVAQILFGDKSQTLQDLKTVIGSLPRKIGPSGTPEGELFHRSFGNLLHQVTDIPKYLTYRTLGSETYPQIAQGVSDLSGSPAATVGIGSLVAPMMPGQSAPAAQAPETQGPPILNLTNQQKGARAPSSISTTIKSRSSLGK